MIGRLTGTIVDRGIDAITIDVGGVGYVVSVTPRTLVGLPGVGDEAVIHTHLHVREDQLALFGFASTSERDIFQLLLGVAGVGPKVALAILATMTPEDLRAAVSREDLDALTQVPGIGKRSAEKLMLELKARLDVDVASVSASGSMGLAREALEGLGYSADEIRGALATLSGDLSVEELVTRSLKELGKGSMA